jgi:hypothetical protein
MLNLLQPHLMKVIYLSYIPLTAKVARDWYIDYLMKAGIEIEFWDVTTLLRGAINDYNNLNVDYVHQINDLATLEQRIIDNSEMVFVVILPKIWQFKVIFRMLTVHNCKTVSIKWGAMPASEVKKIPGLFRMLRSPAILLSKIKNRFHAFVLSLPWYVSPYDLIFAAGQVMLSRSEAARKLVAIGLCDFDQYFLSNTNERIIKQKYVVFLDIYLPYQSDLALVGMQPIDSETYFSELHRFFSMIEYKYGVEVAVALHPKAQYKNDEFRGRKTIRDKTHELVRNAEFVISHVSTSLSYVVLDKKPVLLVYSNEMMSLYKNNLMQQIDALAKYLNAPVFNFSIISDFELPDLLTIDEDCYKSYQIDFLATSEVNGGQSSEIFLREIQGLDDKYRALNEK